MLTFIDPTVNDTTDLAKDPLAVAEAIDLARESVDAQPQRGWVWFLDVIDEFNFRGEVVPVEIPPRVYLADDDDDLPRDDRRRSGRAGILRGGSR